LCQQGKLNEGIAYFYEILKIKPDDFGAHRNLGIALQQLGKRDEAKIHAQEAQRLTPKPASP